MKKNEPNQTTEMFDRLNHLIAEKTSDLPSQGQEPAAARARPRRDDPQPSREFAERLEAEKRTRRFYLECAKSLKCRNNLIKKYRRFSTDGPPDRSAEILPDAED